MPGLTTHPDFAVIQHDSASDFLAAAYPTMRRHETSANIVLAHALKRVPVEAAMAGYQFVCDADVEEWLRSLDESSMTPHKTSAAFWLTLWGRSSSSFPALEVVLSCADWTLGDYPIFLWTPYPDRAACAIWSEQRVARLVEHLQYCVPPERVFSVFGQTSLVKMFSRQWSKATSVAIEPQPFYAAVLSFCNSSTFKTSGVPLPEKHKLRRATSSDLEQVARLCKEFADDSVFFPLTLHKAMIEAYELISKRQIWVYDAQGDIAALCAVTRNTHRVSAITKVYTTPRWRRRGCAEFLVRDVTARLLFECGKDDVVLYVGHENPAQKVYDRVGFVGLCGQDKPAGAEDALELGFQGTKRGHW